MSNILKIICLFWKSSKVEACSLIFGIEKSTLNAGQNNLAKTANCVFLNRKGDILELPPSPNFNVVLEVFVCECAMTSTLILGKEGGGRDNVRGKENVLSPAGFPNFCHNFCPPLYEILVTETKIVATGLKFSN